MLLRLVCPKVITLNGFYCVRNLKKITWCVLDDMMGVHLKVKEEAEKKKNETIAAGEEYIQLTDEMITSSVMQVHKTVLNYILKIFCVNG